jgi:hypothetical protein
MQVRMIYFIRQTIIYIKQSSAHTYKEYGFKHVIGGGGVGGGGGGYEGISIMYLG